MNCARKEARKQRAGKDRDIYLSPTPRGFATRSRVLSRLQWRTKELGTVRKSPSKQLLGRTLLLRTIFLFGFGFIPSFPNFPQQCCGQKSTHSHPFCSKFNFVWGGRGGVSSFSNITGKVPTLLTSIVGLLAAHNVELARTEVEQAPRGQIRIPSISFR